jgi:co-chaperonin GroES (HSP10)
MKLKPLGNRIVVEAIRQEQIGNIVLPEVTQDGKPEIGLVIAVGPGKPIELDGRLVPEPMPVGVGDKVFFAKYGAVSFEDHDEDTEHFVIKADDIYAVVSE